MMDRHDEDEKDLEIERMFEAAREADREAAPAFRQIVAQGRLDRHQHERPRARGARFVWMTAASTVAVVALAAWLGIQSPPVQDPVFPQVFVGAPAPPPVPQPGNDAPAVAAAKHDGATPTHRSKELAEAAKKIQARVDAGAATAATRPEGGDAETLRALGYAGVPSAPEPVKPAPPGRFYQDAQGADIVARESVHGARDRDFKAVVGGVVGGVPDAVPGGTMMPAEVPEPEPGGALGGPVLVSANVQPPELVAKVTPEYPQVALLARMEGRVILQAVIDEDGSVGNVEVLRSSNELFNREAVDALKQWRYKPAMQDGQPVAVYSTVIVDFKPGDFNTESYAPLQENPFLAATENPLSTFSIDVDTASYANVRRFLNQGQRPPRDAVRIEELVNYFRYDYPEPAGREPFGASIEIAECPWNAEHRLARIGLKGREIDRGRREPSNLVFLIDVSGSMAQPNKLPLLQASLGLLVDELDDRDRVAIVVYAGASGLVLPSTPGSSRGEIRAALARLSAGGSTNGGEGLRLAYETARQNFVRGGTNRVILATDGDFNVGVTSQAELLSLIEEDARRGIFLTALGFGMGNYKDSTLEMLADKGNGNYAYIDDLREARKVLVEELTGTLVTIAKDVKVQVEFNPAEVGAYRLIGYENRMLRKEDFNDDRKDAGEIGAGHTVTALYEIVPASARRDVELPSVDPLRYQQGPALTESARRGELFTLKLRYKEPEGERSRLLKFPAHDAGARRGSQDFEFAAAVAGFGMLLRSSEHAGDFTYRDVRELASGSIGRGEGRDYRREFVELVSRAERID